MKDRRLGSCPLYRVLLVSIAGVLIATVPLLLSHSAGAQGAGVRISELQCNADPEVVVIVNEGGQDVDVSSWQLQSDPTLAESFPLFLVRILSPRESVTIHSGPSAAGAFVWSRESVFRDGDPTDFAQLVNTAGDVVAKVPCEPVQQPTATVTATPAQTPAPEPSPTATVLSANGVPFGGGPPGVATGLIPPAAMVVAGSWLLTAGLGTIAVPILHRGRRSDRLDEK